jgi:hypothetical protein
MAPRKMVDSRPRTGKIQDKPEMPIINARNKCFKEIPVPPKNKIKNKGRHLKGNRSQKQCMSKQNQDNIGCNQKNKN